MPIQKRVSFEEWEDHVGDRQPAFTTFVTDVHLVGLNYLKKNYSFVDRDWERTATEHIESR
jgi:hypothetical protein